MQPHVSMQNICKSFYGVEVLHDISFDIYPGEVVALCGENGAGKSTLMKILSAVYKQDSGVITVSGAELHKDPTPLEMQRMGISMIHQELNLLDDMTVAQNIFLSREITRKLGVIDFGRMNDEAKKILESLSEHMNPASKVRDLKIAQKQMVEIAKAISFDVKVLIMDEPTSVLTHKETQVMFELIRNLKARGIGIVYISHRLKEIKEIADRVTILRDGYFVADKKLDEVTERDIARYMVGREVSESIAKDCTYESNETVLEVKNITSGILKDVSFSVRRGEILGFSGLIGAGRSELMEIIFGMRKCESGEVLLHGKPVNIKNAKKAIASNIGFATEDRKETGLVTCRSIFENCEYVHQVKYNGVLNISKASKNRCASMVKRLNIRCENMRQLVKNLSGGNQQKVVLAKWLAVSPEIFIVDEPTRGIDVGARSEIYGILDSLAREGKTIIIVSSDITEVLSICQRIIILHEGRITGVLADKERTEENIMNYATNV